MSNQGYDVLKEQARARNVALSLAGRDIGELPPVKNPDRKARAASDFRFFCETYFPLMFRLPWSQDHLKVIARIEQAVLHGGLFAVAMPRGSGKTTIAECACLWAILHGHRDFVALIGASEVHAEEMLDSIKTELDGNDLLLEDFPEVVYPIQRLDGIANRCAGQLCQGERTHIVWTAKEVVLPTIPGSKASGAIIKVAGITGRIRGMKYKRADGKAVRPSLVVLDDPQTDESARSMAQCAQRESILAGAVLGLAGPGRKISGLMACTVIAPGDMADSILDRDKHPEWNGERTKLVYSFPADQKLWQRYAEIRADSLRRGNAGEEATAFYRANREAMDAGAVVAWPERFNHDELSAIQHAMNLKLQDEAAFFAEYQNEPLRAEAQADDRVAVPARLERRVTSYARGVVPGEVQFVAAGVDCHDDLLYWTVLALTQDARGYVVDYGTWPAQNAQYFSKRDANPTIETALRRRDGIERDGPSRLYAALEACVSELAEREFPRDSGVPAQVGKIVLDAGYLSDVVFRFCRESRYRTMLLPTYGAQKSLPRRDARPKNGARWGEDYYLPPPGRRPVPYALVDSSAWITRVHEAFTAPPGASGAWTLFDAPPNAHRCYADHICAESPRDLIDPRTGERVRQWTIKPNCDNHWLDATKLAGVGCVELGCRRTFSVAPAPIARQRAKRELRVSYH